MSRECVTVFVAREGRHLFETIRDTRVAIVSPGDDVRAPDLVVLPCGQDRRFEQLSTYSLPEWLRKSVVSGSTGLVLDASPEAIPPKPDIVASLHGVIERLGLLRHQCAYVTANWYFERDYLAYCEANNIRQPVRVLHHDFWVWDSVTRFADEGERSYAERLAAFRARAGTRRRRFLSLNRTPRPFKIVLLLKLMNDGLWDAGFVSFGGFGHDGKSGKPRPTPEQLTAALPAFADMVGELAPRIDDLDRYGSVLLGLDHRGLKRLNQKDATEAQDLPEYDESWFSAVTETEMLTRPSRITEKVLKPLVNFHPMVVFGNPGSLMRVREYGFVTFDDVVDESYDEETDPRRRFDMAYAELVRLCRLDDRGLHDLERRTGDRLIFNARWGLTRFPGIYRAQRDSSLVNEILTSVRGRGRAHEGHGHG
jgi:hypothetical protein